MTHNRHWFKHFRDGSTEDMSVDGSGTAVSYRITSDAAVHGKLRIERINFILVDGGMQYGRFGAIVSGLTNGITFKWYDSDDVLKYDYLDGEPIKTNEEFSLLSGVDSVFQLAAGDDFLPVRWTLAKSGLATILASGDYIEILIQDNLSTVVKFRAMAQGYLDP